MEKFKRIVLSIPHAKTDMILFNGWEGCDEKKLNEYVTELADLDVDEVFTPRDEIADKVSMCVFPFSRFSCDVERLVDDEMEEIGQGIVYEYYKDIKRDVSDELKGKLYRVRKAWLTILSRDLKKESTLLIDCHSFTPTEESKDIDVCIGFNEDWSKPDDETLKLIGDTLKECGYRVAFNKPFSNSLTPTRLDTYKSVMLELNKDLYLKSDRKTLRSDIYKVNQKINTLYERLMDKNNG